MEVSEARKKFVPGAREIAMQIKDLNNKLSDNDAITKNLQSKLSAVIAEQDVASNRHQIYDGLKIANNIIRSLRDEKNGKHNQENDIKNTLKNLSEQISKAMGDVNIRNVTEIDKRIDDLQYKLISESVSQKDEKRIASDLVNLKLQKSKLGTMEESSKKIKELDAEAKGVKAEINELRKKIAEEVSKRDKIQAELAELDSARKVKSPEVMNLEAQIASLGKKKDDLKKQRTDKRAALNKLEADYAIFEEELNSQKRLEDDKEKIKKVISELRTKKQALLDEISNFDPKIFDSLIFSVENLKKSRVFSVDVHLYSSFIKFKIPIPSSSSDIEATLSALREKKNSFADSFQKRSVEINAIVAKFDSEISAEQEKLAAMPATKYELFRRDAFKENDWNKV
ncbi:hypothetical protein ENBRE01_0800 [Enteropsectra breve]|nr:hypothetical protein ENBRE01_0800 [Enteropsectra breve]